MRVDRRTFLKLCGVAGVSVTAPLLPRRADAAVEPWGGPYYVMIHAAGGWDPALLCDPRPGTEYDRVSAGVGERGAHRFADYPATAAELGYDAGLAGDYDALLMSNAAFFGKHGERLLVVNGIDTSTNNHEGGSRAMFSGRLAAGYPAFGALVAAVHRRDAAMPFLSGGGYDATDNLVPLTRVSDADSLVRVARPNVVDPNNPESPRYHSDGTLGRIKAARAARWAALAERTTLPQDRRAIAKLQLARAADDVLQTLDLPAEPVRLPGGQLGDLQGLMNQAQLAMSAFQAGLAVSASMRLGGFDTHANHDRDQRRQLAKLLRGIDFVWEEAARRGLSDRIVVLAASDFGRGPHYNGNNANAGKDHFPVTSALMMGRGIRGGRVVGATDPAQLPLQVDPGTLALAGAGGGVTIGPGHIHQALRRLAGVADHPLAERYPLVADELPLL